MKNKKALIIIISVICAYLVLAIVLFGWDNFLNKFQKLYVMLDPDTKWQLKDGIWSDVEDPNIYNWKKYDVYINNQLLGNYNLLYNNKWYLFDSNRKAKDYKGSFLAIKGNKKYNIINFEEEDIDNSEKQLIKEVLDSKKIDYPEEFTYSKKVSLDLNNDGKEESIYTVSNAFTYDTNVNKKFSLILIKGNINQVLYQKSEAIKDQYNLCIPKVKGIMDINKDLKYEIIIECNYFNLLGTCNSLYVQKNGKYEIAKGC